MNHTERKLGDPMSNSKWLDNFSVHAGPRGNLEIRDHWTPILHPKPGGLHFITHGVPMSERFSLIRCFGGYRRGVGSWVRHIGSYGSREEAEFQKQILEKPYDTHRT